jgi:translation initiation factor 2 subunit 1
MVLTKENFPELGELVVSRVTGIQGGYVEVDLEDYKGLESEEHAHGMVHLSELSNRWVKNIHSIISIGQRVVLLVLRIDKERGYVDLSLRRVTKEQKTNKMNAWRYATKAENMLKFFCEQHNITIEQLYQQLLFPLLSKYSDLRTALEEIKEEGMAVLNNIPEIGASELIKKDFITFVHDNVTINKIEISAEFKVRSHIGNGVVLIKNAFAEAKKIKNTKGVEVKIFYVGSPNYRVQIEANDYPDAEKHLEKIQKKVEKIIGNQGSVILVRDVLSNEQKSTAGIV